MRPQVLFLDVNETTLDLNALKKSVGQALGGKEEFLPLWFSTMLHHSLVSTAGDRYSDFGDIGVAALMMVAENNSVDLTEEKARSAIAKIKTLPPHPDVLPAVKRLKEAGFKVITLTNSSNKTVQAQMKNAGLTRHLDALFSIEDIGIYKPHSHTYRWAARKAGADIEKCMLVAAHGWDVAGASWAGMQSAFIARPGQALYPLAPKPDYVAKDFGELADLLTNIENSA